MPDYIYLLESRLSPEQRAALERMRELARSQEMNVYLAGGAVRDLISGQPIRDLDFTVEGNPLRIVRELEKGGARVTWESDRLRHYEVIFSGDADGSVAAARDDVYERPGARPECHFAGIMDDLRRRDFSINAIAISLNTQSLGLLLDPTNGLADLERQEIRALSIHAFTNQPIRLLRILRYCSRMGFKMEARTQEWFELAMERGVHQKINGADAGQEVRALAGEENPAPVLKQWEAHGLLSTIHSQLQKRGPDYDRLNKLARVRGNYFAAGLRPRLQAAVVFYLFKRLKSGDASAALRHLEFRAAEINAIKHLVPEGQKIVRVLKGSKTASPHDAYFFLASVPAEMLAFIEVELPNPRALSKIRNYLQKWRPMRLALPVAELDSLGVPRGTRFSEILEGFFEKQLRGKGRTPEDRTKLLRTLAGIKEEGPKKADRKRKGKDAGTAVTQTTPAEERKTRDSAAKEATRGAAGTRRAGIMSAPTKFRGAPRGAARKRPAARRAKHKKGPAKKRRGR